MLSNAHRGAVIGGYDNHLNHADSIILGGNNITTDAGNTVFVPNLKVADGFKMPTGATDTYVLTTDANGVGTWQAAAGGGGQVDSVVAGTNVTIDNTDPINPIINAAGGGGGGSSIVASYVDNALVVSKPATSNVVLSITGLQYQMEIGKTYYVKMFFNHEGGKCLAVHLTNL